jgi:hypothetical protein
MSSEAPDLAVAPRPRDTPAAYWAFFPKAEAAFWHFVDRSREDIEAQESLPQPTAMPGTNGSPDTAQYLTAECWSASPKRVS